MTYLWLVWLCMYLDGFLTFRYYIFFVILLWWNNHWKCKFDRKNIYRHHWAVLTVILTSLLSISLYLSFLMIFNITIIIIFAFITTLFSANITILFTFITIPIKPRPPRQTRQQDPPTTTYLDGLTRDNTSFPFYAPRNRQFCSLELRRERSLHETQSM